MGRSPQGHPCSCRRAPHRPGALLQLVSPRWFFTNQPTIQKGREFYKKLKDLAVDLGRSPEDVKIMPGISPIVGRTYQEAEEKRLELEELIIRSFCGKFSRPNLGGVDLSPFPMDGPLPELPGHDGLNASAAGYQNVIEMAQNEGLTIRQFGSARRFRERKGLRARHADQIADHLEDWFSEEAADGFNIAPPYLPGSLDDFVDLVVPELQRRGRFRTEYEGRTLRDHLGLARPASRFAVEPAHGVRNARSPLKRRSSASSVRSKASR